MTTIKLNTLAISGVKISDASLEKLKKIFSTVHYHPDEHVPQSKWAEIDVWYTRYTGFPKEVKSVKDVPRTRAIQLSSGESGSILILMSVRISTDVLLAGANVALQHPVFQSAEGKRQIEVCSASGKLTTPKQGGGTDGA